MKKAILIMVFSIFLSGCGLLDVFRNRDSETPPNQTTQIDSAILKPCDPLPSLVKGSIDFDTLSTHYITVIGQYGVCSKKQDAAVKTIKQLANIKE